MLSCRSKVLAQSNSRNHGGQTFRIDEPHMQAEAAKYLTKCWSCKTLTAAGCCRFLVWAALLTGQNLPGTPPSPCHCSLLHRHQLLWANHMLCIVAMQILTCFRRIWQAHYSVYLGNSLRMRMFSSFASRQMICNRRQDGYFTLLGQNER